MKFTDAIKKYGTISNDNGKSGIFYTIADNKIVRFNCNDTDDSRIIENVFEVADLMMSEGWGSIYGEVSFKTLDRKQPCYCFINTTNEIVLDIDTNDKISDHLYRIFNYFPNEEMAQYIADAQMIYRIVLTLEVLNKDMDELKKRECIDEFLESNYGEVLDRISEYERKNNL